MKKSVNSILTIWHSLLNLHAVSCIFSDDNGTEDIKTSSKSPGKRGTSQKSSPSKKLREDITDKS